MRTRNHELALVAKNDPGRLRTRTVETEVRKLRGSRARRRAAWRREDGERDHGDRVAELRERGRLG